MKKSVLISIIALVVIFLTGLILPIVFSQEVLQNSTTDNSGIYAPPITIIGFIQKIFKIGDEQFNIKVQNNKNESLNNLIALVSGKGYSTYDMIHIDNLGPGEKDYIIVMGNFKESGNITLTIKINNDVFYQDIVIIGLGQKDIEGQARLEKDKIDTLNNLSNQLLDLKQKYSELETDYYNKKDDYDLSKASLTDFKKYVSDIEIDIINENIKDAKAKVQLANDAYTEQKKKLSEAQSISTVTKLKNNALVFSTIAGALITFFALYELLKRKSENVVGTIKTASTNVQSKGKKKKKRK